MPDNLFFSISINSSRSFRDLSQSVHRVARDVPGAYRVRVESILLRGCFGAEKVVQCLCQVAGSFSELGAAQMRESRVAGLPCVCGQL